MGHPHWLPTANWGAGCKRHPHPRATESGCLPGTLPGRGTAGRWHPDCLHHHSPETLPKGCPADAQPGHAPTPLRQLRTGVLQSRQTGLFREMHPEENLLPGPAQGCLLPALPGPLPAPWCCSGHKSHGKVHGAGTPDTLRDLGQFYPVFLCLQRDGVAQTTDPAAPSLSGIKIHQRSHSAVKRPLPVPFYSSGSLILCK